MPIIERLECIALGAVLFGACSVGDPGITADTDPDTAPDAGVEQQQYGELAATTYKVFDPANYAGYDPTGTKESSAAFQAAINDASLWVARGGGGLFTPPRLRRSDGTNVGPNAPQAIVRTRGKSVFKISSVHLQPNVRLEIDASSTLIPIHAQQQVMLLVHGNDSSYIDNITVTSYGESSTFEDTGRRCRDANFSSPCALLKKVRYSTMRFPDGSGWGSGATALTKRFVIDLDYRRYPDSQPPAATDDGPGGKGMNFLQARNFLVENVLELAFPGIILYPRDTPSGPGAIGSNTYPSTSGNAFEINALPTQPHVYGENAVQSRNGTVRYMHCEGCTRGYGILEIHAGVDVDYHHISTRGGIGVRWESLGQGQSTRQHATQVVAYDCNVPVLVSPHDLDQDSLQATYVKAISCDNGIRVMTTGGDTRRSSFSHVDIYGGTSAQVVLCRGSVCDSKYGSVNYQDDAWLWRKSEAAVDKENTRSTSSISISDVRCTAASTFAETNIGFGSCSGL